ncbi:MAG: hypothetical protein ACKOPS_04650, partial [Cyanobium sp.]
MAPPLTPEGAVRRCGSSTPRRPPCPEPRHRGTEGAEELPHSGAASRIRGRAIDHSSTEVPKGMSWICL